VSNLVFAGHFIATFAHGTALLLRDCKLTRGFAHAKKISACYWTTWVANWQPDDIWL